MSSAFPIASSVRLLKLFPKLGPTWVPQQMGVGGVQEGIWEVSLGSSVPKCVGTG